MPVSPLGNRWILVLTNHFTRWQDAFPLPDATTPMVATALDEWIFWYFGIPEIILSDQGAQFESSLMDLLCQQWEVIKSCSTLYRAQANGVVDRNNHTLGGTLQVLLLDRDPLEWDRLLPHIMRTMRATPHSATGETTNYLMIGRELRLPDELSGYSPPLPPHSLICPGMR